MPGREFDSPADFNDQFTGWVEGREPSAGAHDQGPPDRPRRRRPGGDGWRLPPVAPMLGWSNQIRLGRDYYVRVDSNDYSVDPTAIGRLVTVTADLERVRVRLDGRLVADHARVWARQMTVTDPAHVAVAQLLREDFARPRTRHDDALVRDLADYDRAFGIDGLDDGLEVA